MTLTGHLPPATCKNVNSFQNVGMNPKDFWLEVDALSKQHQGDKIQMYMALMLEKARQSKVTVLKSDFRPPWSIH